MIEALYPHVYNDCVSWIPLLIVALGSLLWPISQAQAAQAITVSAAVSLQESRTAAARHYQEQTGRRVELNLGASGHLLAQLRDGAPVDLFISASAAQMDDAQRLGLIDADTRADVAGNRLVLIAPQNSTLEVDGLETLADARIARLAIGQPRTVPAGLYAEQALNRLGLIERLRDRLVFGSSVRQVLDYVARGEVDAGIVYATDARAAQDDVRIVATAEARAHDPIRYVLAVVSASPKKAQAQRFGDFLLSEAGRSHFISRGFAPSANANPATQVWDASQRSPRQPTRRLWPPMWLSLKVALHATLLVAAIGIPLAFFMGRRTFVGKSVLDALIILPLVLPPTVVGYLMLLLLGSRGPAGTALRKGLDHSVLFHWHGAVIAAVVVALPLLYLPAKAAFAGVDRELEDLARLLGANWLQQFWHVSLPLARRGIASGLLLAFARALGEFGATVMVLGNLQGRQTLPIAIYDDYVAGDLAAAWPAVVALTAISLGVIIFYNRSILRGDGAAAARTPAR